MIDMKRKWKFKINNNTVTIENKKKFSKFVALKVLKTHRIIG